ncbi:hypothetical protein M513_00929 [Trichuris suis]|uniref:Uncharacterized protein n=1 Tax=Trichuris suis TaxID=68888 RepID=A0A085MLS0_9BILA|nr:hypothetical protein M513_00929 [Trichuris suis]
MYIYQYLAIVAQLVPGHRNKANIAIKRVRIFIVQEFDIRDFDRSGIRLLRIEPCIIEFFMFYYYDVLDRPNVLLFM